MVTDMQRGMNTLALAVQQGSGAIRMQARSSAFAGRGDLVKLIWHDGVGMSAYCKPPRTTAKPQCKTPFQVASHCGFRTC